MSNSLPKKLRSHCAAAIPNALDPSNGSATFPLDGVILDKIGAAISEDFLPLKLNVCFCTAGTMLAISSIEVNEFVIAIFSCLSASLLRFIKVLSELGD